VGVVGIVAAAGDADAAADMQRLPLYLQGRGEALQQPLGQGGGVRAAVDAGQQHGELVADQPGQGMVGTDQRLEAPGHGHQHAVADMGAQAVIDGLEAVQVQVQHGQAPPPGLGGGKGLGQEVVEGAAVGQAGEQVVAGLVAQPLRLLVLLGDVLLEADEVAAAPGGVEYRADAETVPEGGTILAVVEQGGLDLPLVGDGGADSGDLVPLGVGALEEAAVAAEHLLEGVAAQGAEGPVGVDDGVVGIRRLGHDNADGARLHTALQQVEPVLLAVADQGQGDQRCGLEQQPLAGGGRLARCAVVGAEGAQQLAVGGHHRVRPAGAKALGQGGVPEGLPARVPGDILAHHRAALKGGAAEGGHPRAHPDLLEPLDEGGGEAPVGQQAQGAAPGVVAHEGDGGIGEQDGEPVGNGVQRGLQRRMLGNQLVNPLLGRHLRVLGIHAVILEGDPRPPPSPWRTGSTFDSDVCCPCVQCAVSRRSRPRLVYEPFSNQQEYTFC